ncbi:hypothetical protein IWX85_002181 [Polaromonas sp. CG_9.11]|nr:hypothetical protein [Polaromonas sp. CG_9.11]
MAGMVYGQMANRKGIDAMRLAFWRRARKVYACHAAMLLFLFTVIAAVGLRIDEPAVKDLMSHYLAHPMTALLAGLLLVYKPPLLDILPVYILSMLASPWGLAHGLRGGWRSVMAASLGLWLLAQFGLGHWVYDSTVRLTGLAVPFDETGAFGTFSWQFLWVLGLWMGASRTEAVPVPFVFPRWAMALAVLVAVTCLVWRHAVGQTPFLSNAGLNLLFDKWLLAPFRLLDLLALMLVTIRFGPVFMQHIPRLPAQETLGVASLPVFCAPIRPPVPWGWMRWCWLPALPRCMASPGFPCGSMRATPLTNLAAHCRRRMLGIRVRLRRRRSRRHRQISRNH